MPLMALALLFTAASACAASSAQRSPGIRVISGPGPATYARSMTFRFRGPGSADFECHRDQRRWHSCASPTHLSGLPIGRHRFEVRAAEPHGAVEATPARRTFRVVRQRVRFGRSVMGRPLVAVRIGNPSAERKALVVGQIHGDEPEGRRIVRILRRQYGDLDHVEVWTVMTANPDGAELDARKNAHGVDLNRNFSFRWSGAEPPSSGYFGGPRPFSEPESRAFRDLLLRVRPVVSIWYHQPWGAVLEPCGGDARIQHRYAEIAQMELSCRASRRPGTAIRWEGKHIAGTSFVVELAAGRLTPAEARRNAHAAARVSSKGARRR